MPFDSRPSNVRLDISIAQSRDSAFDQFGSPMANRAASSGAPAALNAAGRLS